MKRHVNPCRVRSSQEGFAAGLDVQGVEISIMTSPFNGFSGSFQARQVNPHI
jgi:hypothetical protein